MDGDFAPLQPLGRLPDEVLIPELVGGVAPLLTGLDPMGNEVDSHANPIDISPGKDL